MFLNKTVIKQTSSTVREILKRNKLLGHADVIVTPISSHSSSHPPSHSFRQFFYSHPRRSACLFILGFAFALLFSCSYRELQSSSRFIVSRHSFLLILPPSSYITYFITLCFPMDLQLHTIQIY